ncbi:SEFIR domain-containing protein [Cupriavidus taiwanensis]|nr:SEFIR domain-containing protein [Cupriavidus taiwanensis]
MRRGLNRAPRANPIMWAPRRMYVLRPIDPETIDPDMNPAPKLFISYSWSNTAHEQWVIELAESLVESGVEVLLDKWDLREGHDAIAFMEKMVADPAIKKVAMICDETYARKANGRDGGVGTETQIISKNVYENSSQEKFVAVLASRDAEGKPHLPTYYTSRIYIDLSEPERYAAEFEKLLRWIFDKPLYVKPALGKRPSFIDEPEAVSLGTSAVARRCVDALKQGRSFAPGALDEYLSTFAENLERFRLADRSAEQDEEIVASISSFAPYRNEAVSIFTTLVQYAPTEENAEKVHRFLERIHDYTRRPQSVMSYSNWAFDNFKFLVHELFLSALAIFTKHEQFALANVLLEQPYYVREDDSKSSRSTSSFVAFYQSLESLEHRNKRLNLGRTSLHADMLHQRVAGSGLDFHHLMQADFIAFMRNEIENPRTWNAWWPDTLVYLGRFQKAFEVFARSASRSYFDKVRVLLGINKKEDLEELLALYNSRTRDVPRWHYHGLDVGALLGFDGLCSRR